MDEHRTTEPIAATTRTRKESVDAVTIPVIFSRYKLKNSGCRTG